MRGRDELYGLNPNLRRRKEVKAPNPWPAILTVMALAGMFCITVVAVVYIIFSGA